MVTAVSTHRAQQPSSTSRRTPRPRWSSSPVTLPGRDHQLAKDDIKKTLAGSTMSQIGYTMLGARRRGLRLRDLPLNHGFFKANMLLGPGRSCTAWTTR
jgi:hypothetical protein